jgi:hypothetical protein
VLLLVLLCLVDEHQPHRIKRGLIFFLRPWKGTLSAARVARGHVATLAADVVGYSRLLGRDEAGTLAYESAPPRFGRSQDHGTRGPYRRHQEGRKAGARRLSRESARRRVNPCGFNS